MRISAEPAIEAGALQDVAPASQLDRARELGDDRKALLVQEPVLLGASWARAWLEDMRADRRAIRGGWPGTIPEARSRATQFFDRELRRRGMTALTTAELAAVTTSLYERAKRDWLDAVRASEALVTDGGRST